jgi:hypothetical protein
MTPTNKRRTERIRYSQKEPRMSLPSDNKRIEIQPTLNFSDDDEEDDDEGDEWIEFEVEDDEEDYEEDDETSKAGSEAPQTPGGSLDGGDRPASPLNATPARLSQQKTTAAPISDVSTLSPSQVGSETKAIDVASSPAVNFEGAGGLGVEKNAASVSTAANTAIIACEKGSGGGPGVSDVGKGSTAVAVKFSFDADAPAELPSKDPRDFTPAATRSRKVNVFGEVQAVNEGKKKSSEEDESPEMAVSPGGRGD